MKYNKKLASVSDAIRYFLKAFFYVSKMVTRDKRVIDDKFVERVMLAVTRVNGCKVCSQAHAKRALEMGMSEDEIVSMLEETDKDVPKREAVALMFATNYADCNGKPDKVALERLYTTYGRKNGKAIIASCAIIMIGNTLGIAWDTFTKRFKGIKTESKIFREMGIFLSFILLIPLYLLLTVLGFIFNY